MEEKNQLLSAFDNANEDIKKTFSNVGFTKDQSEILSEFFLKMIFIKEESNDEVFKRIEALEDKINIDK